MIILENEILRAVISEKGAELQSLINKQNGIEYMWSGDAAYWGKYSPILFPIVGALKQDTYLYKEKAYQLPRHGFARESIFLKDKLSSTEAVFTLTQSAATLKVYPFAFTLKLRYQLQESTLICTYEVTNTGYDELLFSIGGHPAFAVPMIRDGSYEDYYLLFNKTEILKRWKLKGGLIADHADALHIENGKLNLQKELFYEDAIVLKNLQSNCITLASNINKHGFNFTFDEFPFFGIWAAKDADFVCLEPWCGIADSVQHDQQLSTKEGIIKLDASDKWRRSWEVECF